MNRAAEAELGAARALADLIRESELGRFDTAAPAVKDALAKFHLAIEEAAVEESLKHQVDEQVAETVQAHRDQLAAFAARYRNLLRAQKARAADGSAHVRTIAAEGDGPDGSSAVHNAGRARRRTGSNDEADPQAGDADADADAEADADADTGAGASGSRNKQHTAKERQALFSRDGKQPASSASGGGASTLTQDRAAAVHNTFALRNARDTLAAEVERLGAVSELVSRDGALLRRSYRDQSDYSGEVVESRHRVKQYRQKEASDRAAVRNALYLFLVVAAYIVLKRILWTFLGIRLAIPLPWPF
jgi:hypothetical protein